MSIPGVVNILKTMNSREHAIGAKSCTSRDAKTENVPIGTTDGGKRKRAHCILCTDDGGEPSAPNRRPVFQSRDNGPGSGGRAAVWGTADIGLNTRESGR